MTTTALATTEEEQALIEKAKEELGENRPPTFPKIKVSYDGEAAPEGGFYLQIFDPDRNEKRTVDIGMNPELTFLKRTVSYSMYNDSDDKLEVMTNEIHEEGGWLVMNTPMWVLQLHPNKAVKWFGEYKAFTEWRKDPDNPYIDSKGRSDLRYTNVLYVYFEHPDGDPGNIYQMFVSATSFSGEMNDPHPDHRTFESFRRALRSSESGVYFGTKCKLSTIERGGADEKNKKQKKVRYFLINFDAAGPSELGKMAVEWSRLEENLAERYKGMFANLPQEPTIISKPKAQAQIDAVDLD